MASGNEILAVVHEADVGPALFEQAAVTAGLDLEVASYVTGRRPELPLSDYRAIVVFGGRPQVDQVDIHPWLVPEKRALVQALEDGVPLLGICLGAQLIAEVAGASVGPTHPPPIGWGEVRLEPAAAGDPLLGGLRSPLETIVWHKYAFELPPGAVALATTPTTLQAFRVEGAPAWAVQFHPEQTPQGLEAWLVTAMKRGELTEADCERERKTGARLEAHQEALASHLFGRFLGLTTDASVVR